MSLVWQQPTDLDLGTTNMFRRHFMQAITFASGSALAAVQAQPANYKKTVTFHVKGFTCITCAVGLETLLRQQKGVLHAEASYPKANVVIEYNPAIVAEASLKGYISEMGFGIEEDRGR